MSKNFQTRLLVSLMLLVIAAVSIPFFDGIPFRIFYIVFSCVALFELITFFKKSRKFYNLILAIIMAILLDIGALYIYTITVPEIVIFILSVCAYDVFAYLFGKMIGGKIFKKSRPFPYVSKNKTWEGTIMGLICSFIITSLALIIFGSHNYLFFACGILGLIGDLFESFLKRTFKIKDSNEIIIKNKVFEKIELLIGGSEGHGGYLDRIDSIAFAATILWLLTTLL